MKLLTERLELSPFQMEDQTKLHELFTDPFVRQFLWDDEVISIDMVKDLLEKNEDYFAKDKWGLWKVTEKADNELIGFVGLWYFFDESQPQLLYGLSPGYTGGGYATEAARAVIDYCFDTLGYDYLVAAMDKPHTASIRVAERLGMRLEREAVEDGKPTLFYKIERNGY